MSRAHPDNHDKRRYYRMYPVNERKTLLDRLESAAALVRGAGDADMAPVERWVQVAALLDELHRKLPKVDAWCVVKTYGPGIAAATDCTWCGCLTKAQAEALMPAIAKHYAPKPWWPKDQHDIWSVERRECEVSNIVPPTMTAAEYVAALPANY